jgi:flagellar biosynthesis GTPase FlhF
MNYYYIDFENVKTAGLKGLDSLPSCDTVKIFAKGGSDQLKFNDIKTLMAAKATVAIEDVVTGTKNALDFQLLADLMIDCMKRAGMSPAPKFIIISADHGYDPAITQMKKRSVNNVYRAVSIKDAENGNFAGREQKQAPKQSAKQEPKQKQGNKAEEGKKEEKPAQSAKKPGRRAPAKKTAPEAAEKSEQKTEQKPAQEKTSAKPSRRRVHSRTINKADKVNTESENN